MPERNDMELYLRMQEPFESEDEANKNLELFFNDVEHARERWCISNTHTIVIINTKMDGGGVKRAIASQHLGDSLLGMSMCAWAYGKESEYHTRRTKQLIEEGKDWDNTETNRGNKEGNQERQGTLPMVSP